MKSVNPGYARAFTWTTLALASALLFGCGGADKSASDDSNSTAASVTVNETAAGLQVKTSTGDGTRFSGSQVEASLYTFAAKIAAGTDAGQTLDGTLVLKSVAQDDGTTALTGKLIGGKLTTPPSDAVVALQTAFQTALDALKTSYKTDIDALRATLKTALDAAATPNGGYRLNDAQRAALKTFLDAVKTRTEQFQSDTTVLVTSYRDQIVAAGGDASSIGFGGHGGRGGQHGRPTFYDVTGTQAADGSLTLKFTSGDTVLSGTGAAATDGSLSGTLSGPATDDTGTWTGTALVKPTPTPPSPPASSASSATS